MDEQDDARIRSTAALTLCEAIITALVDKGLLSDTEAAQLFEDSIDAHIEHARTGAEPDFHSSVAELLKHLSVGANSVSAPSQKSWQTEALRRIEKD